MRHGDLFDAFEGLCAGGDVVDGVKYLCTVVAKSTGITNTHRYSFKDDKSLLMLKSLTVDFFGSNGTLTMFAWITIATVLSCIF